MGWWQAGAAILGAALSAKSSRDSAKAAENSNKMDPRIAEILFGPDGGANGGLMGRLNGMWDTPQSEAMKLFGEGSGSFLTQYGMQDLNNIRNSSLGLMNPLAAPRADAAIGTNPSTVAAAAGTAAQSAGAPHVGAFGADVLWNKGETFNAPDAMKAAQVGPAAQVQMPGAMQAATMGASSVNAPGQNNIDLSRSYNDLIYGQAGNNPYLTGAIGKGINQARNAFDDAQSDMTRNLLETVLPSIRSGAVIAGGYGGSRQGIAEGRALAEMAREGNRAATRFGQGATDAAVSAQAGAYDADRNRALAATQGLGAQQYGVASQNAQLAQQAALANMQAQNQAAQTNYSGQLQAGMANAGAANQLASQNAGLQQQANSTNYAGQLQTNQQNASNLQQANLANQAAGNNASQFNAQQNQQASNANANLGLNNNQFNAGLQQQTGMANLQNQQAANMFNSGSAQQMTMQNLANTQQTNLANMQSQLSTNGLNSNNAQAGISGLSGLLNTVYGNTANQDSYDLNRAAKLAGIMQPFLSGVPNQGAPLYQNSAGNILGGAMAGGQLAQMLMKGFGGSGGGGMGTSFASAFPNGY
jgi:hypothetical protein